MQTIFITGASSGLGKATARLFQAKGWRVIATMRHPEKETELNKLENVILLPMDVTNMEQINETIQKAIRMGVDVVMNNAGYGLVGGFEAYSQQQIKQQLDTNLLGVLMVSQPFVTYFRERSAGGLFLTITSAAGIAANPLASVYSATKFALEGWSEAMNYETNQFGIRFKTIAPGAMNTDYVGRSLTYVANDAYAALWDKMMSGFKDGSLMWSFRSPKRSPILSTRQQQIICRSSVTWLVRTLYMLPSNDRRWVYSHIVNRSASFIKSTSVHSPGPARIISSLQSPTFQLKNSTMSDTKTPGGLEMTTFKLQKGKIIRISSRPIST